MQNKSKKDLSSPKTDTKNDQNHSRVEYDFGGGYVRLKTSEAQLRQAAHDIRSTEDILIELLRNSRDAQAHNIFVALQHEQSTRTMVVIDDGIGIPSHMQKQVFQPRVTSKLDTAHMDKWGMHGRGMALYSVMVNADNAFVQASKEGLGTSIVVQTDLNSVKEKTDQSTFPHFEINNGTYAMRGPHNILRTAAEFSLEHRKECLVYCGSFTEIAATLYAFGLSITDSHDRAFSKSLDSTPLVARLAYASDAQDFVKRAAELGLTMSTRSARRILDNTIEGIPPIIQRLENESFPKSEKRKSHHGTTNTARDLRSLKFDPKDLSEIQSSLNEIFDDLDTRYYLEHGTPQIRIESESVKISIPIKKLS